MYIEKKKIHKATWCLPLYIKWYLPLRAKVRKWIYDKANPTYREWVR